MNRHLNLLLSSLLLFAVSLAFQNCGSGFQGASNESATHSSDLGRVLDDSIDPNPSVDPTPTPIDPTPQPPVEVIPEFITYIQPNIVSNCAANLKYNGCIFWKNPVAQKGSAYSSPIQNSTNLNSDQVHAINVLGTDNSGYLRNSTINITSTQGTRILASNMNFKRTYSTAPEQVIQLMTYHWMQSFISFMKAQAGIFHGENKGINVDATLTSLNNAQYLRNSNVVQMGFNNGTPFGLSGEIAIHELGHANHRWASNFNFSTAGTQNCPTNIGGTCCNNKNTGCAKALSEGVSDYMYTIIFPQSTAGGETVTNNTQAPSRCGLNRNISENKNLTINSVTCSNIHILGMIYAGIWFEVRKQATLLEPTSGAKKIDTLFSEHLMTLIDTDNWSTTKIKILALDRSLYNSQFTTLFQNEFTRRGL